MSDTIRIIELLEQRGERATEEIGRQASDRGLDATAAVVRGTPAREIRQYTDEQNVDLITMGTHGRRGLDRFLTQSVAERVIRTANCPVLTLRRQSP